MVKILCPEIKGVQLVRNFVMMCDTDCQICHGAGYTEQAVVKVNEVKKYVMDYETWSETVMGVPVFYVHSDGVVKWLDEQEGNNAKI